MDIFNTANVVSLLCVLGLLVVLGGGVLVMLYGWRVLLGGVRGWVDRQ